jgi:hypothetical protein
VLNNIEREQPASPPQSTSMLDRWKELESAVKQEESFEGKENAIEIISDIKLKLLRNEKVSNFLLNGLKESLRTKPELQAKLDAALQSLKN